MTLHFDHILCAALDAETAFEEGRCDGDFALLHIDDLRAAIRVLRAATELVDDTEFDGQRHEVPAPSWEGLAAALRGEALDAAAARSTGVSDEVPGRTPENALSTLPVSPLCSGEEGMGASVAESGGTASPKSDNHSHSEGEDQ